MREQHADDETGDRIRGRRAAGEDDERGHDDRDRADGVTGQVQHEDPRGHGLALGAVDEERGGAVRDERDQRDRQDRRGPRPATARRAG